MDACGVDNPLEGPEGAKRHRYTPHSCRHTFATLMKRVDGADKDKLELIGHTSNEMLRHYQDVSLKDLRKITDVYKRQTFFSTSIGHFILDSLLQALSHKGGSTFLFPLGRLVLQHRRSFFLRKFASAWEFEKVIKFASLCAGGSSPFDRPHFKCNPFDLVHPFFTGSLKEKRCV